MSQAMTTGQHQIGDPGISPTGSSQTGTPPAASGRAKELRVMQVLPNLVGNDMDLDALAVAKRVVDLGGEAIIASSGGPMAPAVNQIGAHHIQVPLDRKNPLHIWRNGKRLAKVARQFGANVIHARSRSPAWSAKAAANETGAAFVSTIHGLYTYRSRWKKRYNSVMANGAFVITPSDFAARHMYEHYAADPNRLIPIPRGIDLSRYDPNSVDLQAANDLRERLRFIQGRPVILQVGRVSFWKGQHIVVDALKKLGDLSPYLLIVSSSGTRKEYTRDLRKQIRGLGLENQVHILDQTMDMPLVYMVADCVVSGSVQPEAFIRAVAEGMSMGRPCIVPEHGSGPEQVVHHETGWLYKPGDSKALADAIRESLSLSADQYRNLSSWSMDNVRRLNDQRLMANRTISVYLDLI